MRTLLNIFHYDSIWADNIWQRAIALIPAGKAKSMRRGPAFCLAVLAWTWGLHYPADGVLGFCNRQVNLRTCDFADVRALMLHAWETRVYNAIVKRKAWQNTHPFSLDGAAKLWSKDDTRADHYIRLATCGAFPDSAVRKHFQTADNLVCPFCKDADDTHNHRILECAELGERHPDLVLLREQAQDDGIEPSQLPVVALCDAGYQLDVLHAGLPDSPQIGADFKEEKHIGQMPAPTLQMTRTPGLLLGPLSRIALLPIWSGLR